LIGRFKRLLNQEEARQIVEAKSQSERQPVLNLQIAKAYLAGADYGIATRTWQNAVEALTNTKQGANQERWRIAARDKAFAPLMPRIIIETPGELLYRELRPQKDRRAGHRPPGHGNAQPVQRPACRRRVAAVPAREDPICGSNNSTAIVDARPPAST
jgi:hypothetical protein